MDRNKSARLIPQKELDRIKKYLDEHRLNCEIEPFYTQILITILWGDWKHEHMRCDYLMSELGYRVNSVETIETDGSDCYSAVRHYIRPCDIKKDALI